jgi:DNA/RNA-binding domain of Phe-tRNA-synthetase-like protein
LPKEQFSKNEVINVWRQAFQKFKTKKGARASIEALFKRVSKGNKIPNINPLVDLYNSVSLKYALPCGGEDIDTFVGDIRLTQAERGESFLTLGSDKNEPSYPGEVVYKDDAGAICRCWNWRESVRTLLTEKTRNAFLCIESVDQNSNERLEDALEELKNLVQLHLSGECNIHILDIDNRSIIIEE